MGNISTHMTCSWHIVHHEITKDHVWLFLNATHSRYIFSARKFLGDFFRNIGDGKATASGRDRLPEPRMS